MKLVIETSSLLSQKMIVWKIRPGWDNYTIFNLFLQNEFNRQHLTFIKKWTPVMFAIGYYPSNSKLNWEWYFHYLNIYFIVLFFGLMEEILMDTKKRWIKIWSNIICFLLCEAGVCATAVTLMKTILSQQAAFPEILIYKSWIAAGILHALLTSMNHMIIIYNSFLKVS